MLKKRPWPESFAVETSRTEIAVAVRHNARARSYRLTIAAPGKPVLTVPPNGRISEAEGFLRRHAEWLAVRLERQPGPVALAHGARIPLRGAEHLIEATGKLRGQVSIEAEEGALPRLLVPGEAAHIARRLTDWLKKQALADLEPSVALHAANLGVRPTGISMRSQSTRWGSCSSAGKLNFNWRLVLAPDFVLDYVAAHEVAHMVEMNHSPAFWRTVEKTLPDMERGRAWLKAHGRELMAIEG